ncbi:MAG: 4Fe-4S binding protein [Methanoregula sp.]
MSMALKRRIIRKCAALDIPLVGFAPADRWDTPLFEPWVPEAFRPAALFPETKTVMVIGIPVSLPVIDSAPSIYYHELYRTVNTLLDTSAYRIATALTEQGYPSVWTPRDGYGSIEVLRDNPYAFFSHRHAAYLCGLGTFGLNNVILTPEYGPRVRFTSIFTSADIPPDPVREQSLCTRCMKCADACPVHAIPDENYPAGLTDKTACAVRSEGLQKRFISPCGLCIKVCPVGMDRLQFNRTDMAMYDEDNPAFDTFHKSWKHIRSYGRR